jgi:hypothetical protein
MIPEEVWRNKSDEQLHEAAWRLAEYTPEGQNTIRAELERRQSPEWHAIEAAKERTFEQQIQAQESIEGRTNRLRGWFTVYLVMLVSGYAMAIPGVLSGNEILTGMGGLLFLGAVVPYIGAIVNGYKIQRTLNAKGLCKSGAWQVIAGALILNPLAFGFWIPLSVLRTVKRLKRLGTSAAASVS